MDFFLGYLKIDKAGRTSSTLAGEDIRRGKARGARHRHMATLSLLIFYTKRGGGSPSKRRIWRALPSILIGRAFYV